jgi:3-oxoacyl-[acyl-carrier-protein] synthase-3
VLEQAIGILGTGSYLPKDEIINDVVAGPAGVTAEWIERKTQIMGRRYAAPAEATSDLAARAAGELVGGHTQLHQVIAEHQGVPSVTAFNNNPRTGYLDQSTNIFMIKGTRSPSVVPINPHWSAPSGGE